MSATTGTKPANPAAAKAPKPPPEGVEKSLKATLPDAMGLAAAMCTTYDMARVDRFFTTPMAEHKGFQSKPSSLSYPAYSLPLCLMTKKKKPVAAFYMFDEGDKTKDSGVLVLALRGDRKLENISLVEVEEKLMGALKQSVFVMHPDNPCNFHPWYASILSSFSDKCAEATQTVSGANVTTGVKSAISKNRIMVAMVPPSPIAIESVYHKLAIDVAPAAMTSEKLQAHKEAWLSESSAPNKLPDPSKVWDWFDSITSQAKEFAPCKPQSAAPKTAPAPAAHSMSPVDKYHLCVENDNPAAAAVPAAPKRSAVIKDDDDDMLEAAPAKQPEKPAGNKDTVAAAAVEAGNDDDDDDDEPPKKPKKSKKSKKEKREDLYKRGGQSKFIADTIVNSRKEDEREEREERAFKKKLKKYKDTDDESDSSSDSDSGKKRKKRRRKERSDSESEMSDDYSDSEEDESDEDDSDEESDEESSDEEESATSSDEEDPPPKKKRLVKAADAEKKDGMKQTKLNLVSADHPIATAPAAAQGSSDQAMPDAVDADEPAEKKKAPVRTAPARENREGVAATIKLMLDAVEGCVGIPLTMTEKINSLVSDLREGFKEYESEKFPIKQTYKLHTQHAKLTIAIINVVNAGMTVEQRNNDASASRRLAVSTTSALMSIVPSLDEVDLRMRESVKAIEALQKMTAAIAEDMKTSASTIDEE